MHLKIMVWQHLLPSKLHPLDQPPDLLYYSPSPWIHPLTYCTTAPPPGSTPGHTVLQPLPLDPPLDILYYSPSPWIHPWAYCTTAPPPGSTPGHTVLQKVIHPRRVTVDEHGHFSWLQTHTHKCTYTFMYPNPGALGPLLQ